MKLGRTTRVKRIDVIGAFTIAEVLVAVGVLLVISIGFYAGLSSCFGVVESSREDLRATQVMVQKLEAIRLCNWAQLSNFSFQETYDPMDTSNHLSGAMYYGTVTTNAASTISSSAAYKPNICLVTVTVNWTNFNGRSSMGHTRQMQTHVARYGLQNYIWGAN